MTLGATALHRPHSRCLVQAAVSRAWSAYLSRLPCTPLTCWCNASSLWQPAGCLRAVPSVQSASYCQAARHQPIQKRKNANMQCQATGGTGHRALKLVIFITAASKHVRALPGTTCSPSFSNHSHPLSPYPWPRLWPVDPLPLLHNSWSWSSTLSHGPRHLFSAPSHGQDKDASRISGFLARRKHVADDCIESWRKWYCPAKPRPQHGLEWRNNTLTSRGFHRSRILAFPFSPSAVSFPRC